ncbi:glycosyltransferase family 2 protein [Geomonas oryzisoli]|uniref:Glycosyltransferase family 2 protein n=1 Tax=Geomonas oryzisoli TaxID=2847992 RepID=A0ABX8J9F4_9BACT|nr:glycosyltransferase family A protein [Geomonas oryzisoli]QWV95065.1 glycosyltransferase family 2 protein [Geomonas oryzisoli]
MTGLRPKVSVVIPCYNHGIYLDEAVDSVLAQSFTDFEIVIVNDGSTDPYTVDLLARYRRPKTRVLHTENAGVSSARNSGIAAAQGDYILPLDADDRIAPSYLEKGVAILDARPEVGIVYCDEQMFGERDDVWIMPEYDPVALLFDNQIFPSAFFRKSDWEKVGGYSSRFVYGWEDWDFWITMSTLKKEVTKIPELLYYYRIRSESRDHSMRVWQKIAMMSLIILRHKTLYLNNTHLLCHKILQLTIKYMKSAFLRHDKHTG